MKKTKKIFNIGEKTKKEHITFKQKAKYLSETEIRPQYLNQ